MGTSISYLYMLFFFFYCYINIFVVILNPPYLIKIILIVVLLPVSKKSCFFEHKEIKKPLQLPEILGPLKEQKGKVSLS